MEGFIVVSKEQFFAYVNPRDIVTSVANPNFTVWETRNREEIGRSFPGWKDPQGIEKYMLKKEIAHAKTV